MPEMDNGNDPGSSSKSDLSNFESESSCSELAVSSRAESTAPSVSSTAGEGPAISYYHLLSACTRMTISALRHYTAWSYSQLQHEFNIPYSTLHRIIYGARDVEKNKINYPSCGHHCVIDSAVKWQLINVATAST